MGARVMFKTVRFATLAVVLLAAPATQVSAQGAAGTTGTSLGTSPPHGGQSITPPGALPTGVGSNTPATAGGTCGPSLSDPTSGTPMPLTPRLSPAPTMGGCE